MSDTSESWAVEEYIEDAIVAYLESVITSGLNIYEAWTDTKIEYPCAVVHAGDSDNVSGTRFNGVRQVQVSVAVMSEAKTQGDLTARLANRDARDKVIDALAQEPLATELNSASSGGVSFSDAMITGITRSVDTDKRVFVSEINLEVIAAPAEITTTTTTTAG